MNKQEVAEHLKSLGYNAFVEGGIVQVEVENPLNDRQRKKLAKEIYGTGYNSSWGWRVPRKKP